MRMPLVAMLLITISVGFGLGWLTSALLRRRRRE
jgi:hypothetical protein